MHFDISSWIPILMAKFCHDLASPLGSLGLVLEMLNENKVIQSETTHALQESCEGAQMRLKFYRLLFTDKASLNEAQTVLERVSYSKSLRLEWQGVCLDDDRLTPLMLGLFMIGSETLIRGGAIKITLGPKVSLDYEGPTIQWHPECLDAVCDKISALRSPNTRTILISYVHYLAYQLDKSIAYESINRHKFSMTIC